MSTGGSGRPAMTPERALAHPLRARLLSELTEREASPVELAAEMEQPLGVVSYHVRVLAQAGMLDLVDRTFKRGAVQHHYRARDLGFVTARLALPAARAEALAGEVRALVEAARTKEARGGADDVELTVLLHRSSGTARS
jgi:DNA-binding transcriptional ArsR family regulator